MRSVPPVATAAIAPCCSHCCHPDTDKWATAPVQVTVASAARLIGGLSFASGVCCGCSNTKGETDKKEQRQQ
ncbi:hypothetical protein cyc_07636 [Cyclospora cayetanensis]|uniref:Uncharacterized protein n=1 Tax=Cyclospora cayetanensis TaxID=88456 RepID=A0A1D3D351_9EIME|nr:hypothetical protein cyc_07636 [Cyclospora cayetanensis]